MPTKPNAPSRTRIATVRFEPGEYSRLEAAAAERGLSVSEIIRRASLGRVLPEQRTPQMDAETITELRRIGVNLNQSVSHFNRWSKVAKEDKSAQWENWKKNIIALTHNLDELSRRLR